MLGVLPSTNSSSVMGLARFGVGGLGRALTNSDVPLSTAIKASILSIIASWFFRPCVFCCTIVSKYPNNSGWFVRP